MSYKLAFREEAWREWQALAPPVRHQFKKKLVERCQHPKVPASRLAGSANRYKIKLRQAGYRLVYEVRDHLVCVIVVAVGKRERHAVYKRAAGRF